MADAKNQVTPEQAAADRDAGFAAAEARRAEKAQMKQGMKSLPSNPASGVHTGGTVLSMTIGRDQIGTRNLHVLDTLLPKEPVIIFRAKDILSTMVLQHYTTLLETYSPYSAIIEDMVEKINEFREWQHANPTSIRLPD